MAVFSRDGSGMCERANQRRLGSRGGGFFKETGAKTDGGEERTACCTSGLKYVLDLLTFSL